jgi:hypothetical protein
MGFEKEDAYFFKQMGKAMLCTYTLFGVAWLWNETSPLGWWTLKPRPKVRMSLSTSLILGRVIESLACSVRIYLFGLTGIGGDNRTIWEFQTTLVLKLCY